ncbi:IgGFc-binding protein-like [Mytilus edulis]|uniref:IgGFc-binding protein-like n=1 Tax=Mytilus edulis TaxID=6550 RepID=UPI0039EFA204
MDVTVSGGAETVVEIPSDLTIAYTSKSDKSILVQADNVIVLFASNMQADSGDSFIVYPVEVLSTEYVSVNLKSKVVAYQSMSAIIAVNDQTVVHLSLPLGSSVMYNGDTYTFGSQLSVNLIKYEIFQFSSKDDLSGTTIFSNYPIAVISGHQLGNPSVSVSATIDMILEMLIPWKFWSTQYVAISNPVFNSGYGELIRIFTLCENATIIIDKPGVHSQINVSQESFYEFPLALAEAAVITSDKPVLVSQVSSSHPYAGSRIGDPRSVLPAPIDSWLHEYTFSTPGRSYGGSFDHGLVLVAYSMVLDEITLDNESLDPSTVWFKIADTNLNYTVLPLSQGSHTLKCIGNLKCWGYVFGIGVYEEYGTSIGRSFIKTKATDTLFIGKVVLALDMIDDHVLLTTPVSSTITQSRTECAKMCLLAYCSFLSFRSADGVCYLYTEEQKCSPKKESSNFRRYYIRDSE